MSTITFQLSKIITYVNIADITLAGKYEVKCELFDPSRPYHVMEMVYFQEIP